MGASSDFNGSPDRAGCGDQAAVLSTGADAILTACVKDADQVPTKLPFDWEGWEPEPEVTYATGPDLEAVALVEHYSARALAGAVGISKTEVSSSLRRSFDAGLARRDRDSGLPRVNRSALLEIGEHCLRWLFPVHPGPLARGIPTGFAAPVLATMLETT
ncbi:hypothetical protein [Thiocapsa sp.]|uniref:hypothetical protein n=1 Tax=Thiocapsa sp. TaxID=2024551 RepID=UPI0025E5A3F2|nr:hypothetical protein [Thiocapsa sp.]